MAKEANYVFKITLTEADTVRNALVGHVTALEATAQRLLARRESVPVELTEQIDAARRLLARM